MIERASDFLRDLRDRQRMNQSLTKGAIGMQVRRADERQPWTWEFSGFSQNGEDGILQFLRGRLMKANRHFIEIGSADGLENNSSWMAVAEKYNGVMIDGSAKLVARATRLIANHNIGVHCRKMFVTTDSANDVRGLARHPDPDVLSVDIDGNDYYIVSALLNAGLRPKIIVVEYNSAFGPDQRVTIPYQPTFDFNSAHPTKLYYGVSIGAWRHLLGHAGYRFVSVDSNGVNAFFVEPGCFEAPFLAEIEGSAFEENRYQTGKFGTTHESQFALIADMPLKRV